MALNLYAEEVWNGLNFSTQRKYTEQLAKTAMIPAKIGMTFKVSSANVGSKAALPQFVSRLTHEVTCSVVSWLHDARQSARR